MVTGQCQARVLRAEVGRLQELDGEKLARTNNRKYRPGEKQKPDPTVAKARKRLAARFYQLKTGHCLTEQYSRRRRDARTQPFGSASTAPRPGTTYSNTVPSGRTSRRCYGIPTRKLLGPNRERHKTSIAELLADRRCSQAVLDFLENTDVGRTSGPPVAEEAGEEASKARSGRKERGRRGWLI